MMRMMMMTMVAVLAGTAWAEVRTWTSRTGTTLEAEFAEVRSGVVLLRTPGGAERRIKLADLSDDDQRRVSELSNSSPAKNESKAEARAKASDGIRDLFGEELRDARKKKVPVDSLAGKTVGVYFSAHWCPPCRAFTPQLVDFHKEMAKQGKPFEVVFVSSDRDEGAMHGYMKEMEMPWLALPFGDRRVQQLKSKFGVKGIPKLVVVDADGNLITDNGRMDVVRLGAKAFGGW